MEAIILAGGLGTRLQSIVNEVPKPMAPIKGEPFLKYIFEHLKRNGVSKVILSVGYKHEKIIKYFNDNYEGINVVYSIEKELLGTGGAIRKALSFTKEKNVIVLNGDTFFDVNLRLLMDKHEENNSDLTIALKSMRNFDRYGTVLLQQNRIMKFQEKRYEKYGNINGGIYVIKKRIFKDKEYNLSEKFSFEKDFIEKNMNKLKMFGFVFNGYFVDIGIPEDYQKANIKLPNYFNI
ncbi:D-glycero-alpha-D-manno-heptose 1-phosphate guanylyltransferase [Clostridium tepidiprofundi DSM 19306]|uniref:D-glycero-alpha-D-manno-heptose 1-phosphate guanylyltransferase n=1 Tax=Clostridium tepidiprofundi DSM 19306 TaxID=1121338 RepID=A0A151B3G0_9CLOT|nr:nucleotidyltransferase family protein [Clostridium tepidiprofundi]KYH34469.1 D-glycero-alpha-D-manno-heptose 1-phosphate guanylyltransferase [Clostridium tepidiprofundi DSM 19306]